MSEGPREGRLDRVLDDALGRMSGGDGPADMRRRVLARLAEPPRRVGSLGMVLSAGAAIAVLAGTAALLLRPEAPAPETPVARREGPPVTPATRPSAVTAHPSEPVHAAARAIRPASRRVAQPPSPEAGIAAEAGTEDAPMAPVEPIAPAALGVAPMQTEALTIAPLRMDSMEIVPLVEPRSE
jgi:hypothetical protein